jgi:DNA invertase Pin-like site-specific DNA recombinase
MLAEKEQAMISTRTNAALAAAKAGGVILGGTEAPRLARAANKADAVQHAAKRAAGHPSTEVRRDHASGIAQAQWYTTSVKNVLARTES